jgi:hypothetical protein
MLFVAMLLSPQDSSPIELAKTPYHYVYDREFSRVSYISGACSGERGSVRTQKRTWHGDHLWSMRAILVRGREAFGGIVNLFTVIDEFSPRRELFRNISAKNEVKLPEKEDLFPTLRGK